MSELYQTVGARRVLCGRCRHEMHQTRMEGGPFDSPTGLTFTCGDCRAIYGVCRVCGWYMSDGKTCELSHEGLAMEGADSAQGDTMAKLPDGINEADLVRDPGGRSGHWYHAATDTVYNLGSDYRPPTQPRPIAGVASTLDAATAPPVEPDGVDGGPIAPTMKSTLDEARAALSGRTNADLIEHARTEYSIKIRDPKASKDSIIAAIVAAAGYPVPKGAAAAYDRILSREEELGGKRIEVLQGPFGTKRGMITEVGVEGDNFDVRAHMDSGDEIPLAAEQWRLLTDEEVAADEAALAAKQQAAG